MKLLGKLKKTEAFRRLSEYRWREHMTHPGHEHPDQTFYVIRRHDMHAGLFSFVATNLASIRVAEEKGYIPVIDMQNSANSFLLPEEIGKVNAWDKLFDQPCGYTLADCQKARNVVLGSIHPPEPFPDYRMLEDETELSMWNALGQKYIRLKEAEEAAVQRYMKEELPDGKTLAVVARGTDYLKLKPFNHPIQPEPSELIRKAKEVMKEQDCRYLYLATEDNDIWDLFQEAFPGQVHSYQKQHYDVPDGKYIADIANDIKAPIERNREYLISISVVARCSCLLAGASGGTYGALLMTKGYDYRYIYDLGRYK